MKSTIFSSVVLSSVVGFLATQQAGARMTSGMVERSLSDSSAQVVGGHLHLLSKKNDVSPPHKKHRRHHSRKVKRGTCSSSSSSSSTSSGNDNTSSDVGTGSASSRNGSGVCSSSSANTSASTASSKKTSSSSSSGTSSASGSSSSSASSSSSSDDTSPISGSSSSGSASSLGSITGFQGENSGIGSWFRTNSGQDSTNGRSWCQLNYQDSWMGFAPSVGTMLKNFGGVTDTAGKAYCGREAKATNPNNGKTALIYIVDGFDDKWVLSPGSIDLTVGAFEALYGSFDGNKNTVIKDLQWEFTGNVKEEYTFNASGKK